MLSSPRALALTVALLSQFVPTWARAQGGATTDQQAPSQPAPDTAAPPAAPAPAPAAPSDQAAPAAPAAPTDQPAETVSAPAAPGGKQKFGEEIVVTGSRIRRKDLTTPAPVTVLSREQVQASGKVSIGDFLQSLPEQGNALNTSVNNGGDGSTRVALRGMTPKRTLVLLNGRRMVPGGTGADDSVDLNSIPTAAIERIEVLKDGASAIYGSDAIAGVINIITRKKFDRTEVNAYTGTSGHGDGTTYDFNATTGTSGDRGNILFSAGYTKQNSVMATARDFSAVPLIYNGKAGRVQTQGSGTVPSGRIINDGQTTFSDGVTPLGNACWQNLMKDPDLGGGDILFDPTGGKAIAGCVDANGQQMKFSPYLGSKLPSAQNTLNLPAGAFGGTGYNFQPFNYLVTPQQRIQLFSTGDIRMGNVARGYFEASYVNRQSDQLLAPEPLVPDGIFKNVVISKDNIYNPFGRDFSPGLAGVPPAGVSPGFPLSLATGTIRRRMQEFGNRTFTQDIDSYRFVTGIDGTLPDEAGPLRGWFWDLSLNYGRTTGSQLTVGSLNVAALQSAVGPSFKDANGLHCGTPGNPIQNCVPLNLFGGANSITPDQISNLTFSGTQRGINQLTSFQAQTSGELFPLMADRPVGLAVGYEFRRLVGATFPDPLTASGNTTGVPAANTSGGYSVNEGYAELSIPVVNHMPGVENLEFTAAGRVFHYSNFGSDWTYKLGARYSIIPDITIRGTVGNAFRAPSIADLFLGHAGNFAPVADPCSGVDENGVPANAVDPNSTLGKNCVNAKNAVGGGASALNNGDTQTQLLSTVGGNPTLQPEKANIWTLGIVLEPSFVKNLTVTLDYYNIRVFNTITDFGSAVILNGCYSDSKPANQAFCGLISRNPGGTIINILDLNQNVGKDASDGLDIAARYAVPTRQVGRFNLLFDGTWLHKYDRVLADGSLLRARGTFDMASQGIGGGTGGVFPAWKFNAGVLWGLGNVGAGVTTKFIGSYKECGEPNGLFRGLSTCFQNGTEFTREVSAYNTWDAFVSYNLATSFGRTNFGVGIQNAFDARPAAVYNGFTGASDPTAYDFMGRFMYVRLTHSI